VKLFKDCEDREWTVKLTVEAVKRVKDLEQVDLLDLTDGKLIERLANDPITLCNVLYAVCKPQADDRSVSGKQFGEGMAGDALEHAATALFDELVAFFPHRKRTILAKALATARTIEAKMHKRAMETLNDPKLAEKIESLLTVGGLSSNASLSADSSPTA
jgi:hypothetical protein